jgi:hypothetical protein
LSPVCHVFQTFFFSSFFPKKMSKINPRLICVFWSLFTSVLLIVTFFLVDFTFVNKDNNCIEYVDNPSILQSGWQYFCVNSSNSTLERVDITAQYTRLLGATVGVICATTASIIGIIPFCVVYLLF